MVTLYGRERSVFCVTSDPFRTPGDGPQDRGWEPFGEGRKRSTPLGTAEHPFRYRAYDADGGFCAEGTCANDHDALIAAHDFHQNDAGSTSVELYDRRTGRSLGRPFG